MADGAVTADVRSRIKGNSGMKVRDRNELHSAVAAVLIHKSGTFRQLECVTRTFKSVLPRSMQNGAIVRRPSRLKTYLTDGNKLDRLRFVLTFVREPAIWRSTYFDNIFDHIHIDEKWFII